MSPRIIMLTVASVSLIGFLFLTVYAAIDRGFTVLSVLSILVLIVLGIGVLGALFEQSGED